MREAGITRQTAETSIELKLGLDGEGRADIETGLPFLDHMLSQLAKHGLLNLWVRCDGDLHIDGHHTTEDVGICLGQALRQTLGNGAGIRRFGHAIAPLDEALVLTVLDCSGRSGAHLDLQWPAERIGTFDTELIAEFMRALANNAGITLHVRQLAGSNAHHIAEAAFKSLALALRQAVEPDPRRTGVPSTKGALL